MTDTDLRAKVLENVRESAKNMAAFRGVSYPSMLEVHARQCAENLRDSTGTPDEAFWRLRLDVVDRELAEIRGAR